MTWGAAVSLQNPDMARDAEQLMERCQTEIDHCRRVAAHALQVLTYAAQSKSSADMAARLELAALLHDTGHFVSAKEHHKHSRYLILNAAETRLWPPAWRADVAALALSHRKQAKRKWLDDRFGGRLTVLQAAAVLRVADGLDRARDPHVHIRGGEWRKDGFHLAVTGLDPLDATRLLSNKADLWPFAFGYAFHLNATVSP